MNDFNPQTFVEQQINTIQKTIGKEKALIAVSGGVDSVTSAVLTHRAIGENLACVMIDDAFMRLNEPKRVARLLAQPPIEMKLRIIDVQERFLKAFKGLRDAEEKRKVFRESFYKVLGETAQSLGCSFLVQGTIKADIVETAGGVKTQHNVLSQIGINPAERFGFKVVEPLVALYKPQVRMVARHLGIPREISERQPFPGPGLSVRVVGEVTVEKLDAVKKATAIVEEHLVKQAASQYFAAIIENNENAASTHRVLGIREVVAKYLNVPSRNVQVKVFREKATGVEGGKRRYGEIVLVGVKAADGGVHSVPVRSLVALQKKVLTANPSFTRLLYVVDEAAAGKRYTVIVRSIETRDFLTADVSDISWETLKAAAAEILKKCASVSRVCYDVTPKPPATVEME